MHCTQPQQPLPSSSRAASWGAWTPLLPQLPGSPTSWATLLQLQCRALASQVCRWAERLLLITLHDAVWGQYI